MQPPLLSTASRYFMEVVRTGSITEAARTLHVAPSAVSRQVAKLEASLDTPLFERHPRGMALTDAGERLAAWVRNTEHGTQRLREEVRGLSGQQASRVHVACTEGFATSFLPEAMASFRASHPHTSVFLRVGSPADVSRWLLRGEVEAGVKFAVAPEKGLHIELSLPAPIMAVVSASHALARARRMDLARLLACPLALPETGTTVREALDQACSELGVQYEAAYSGNFSALLALAARGDAVTLASLVAVQDEVRAGRLAAVPLDEAQFARRHVQLLSLAGRELPATPRAFVQHLRARLEAPAVRARRG